jgi:WD40 repeat protein
MVWNVSSGEVLGKVELTGIGSALFPYLLGRPAKIFSVVFISLDNSVLAAGEVMANFVWYKDAGGTASASNNYSSGDPTIFSIAFDPEGDFEAIGRSDGLVLNPIDDEGVIQADATMTLSCHSDAVSSVAFNFDGSVLASGSWDDTVCLWNMATDIPEQIGVLTGHTNDVTGVAFSLDGSLMASSSLDGTLRLWDVETQEELAVLSAPESTEFRSVAFSPDGTMIATAGSDGMVRLWGGPEL